MSVEDYKGGVKRLGERIQAVHDDYMLREVEAQNGKELMEERLSGMEGMDDILQNLRAAMEWTEGLARELEEDSQSAETEHGKVRYSKERISELRHEAYELLMRSTRTEANELQSELGNADSIAIEGSQQAGAASQGLTEMVGGTRLAIEKIQDAIAAITRLRPQAEVTARAFSLAREKHQEVRRPLGEAATKAEALITDL